MRIPLSALLGLVLTGGFLFIAVFAQLIAPYPIDSTVGGVWDSPSATHWLGTDTIGRDILSRLIYGAQITIFVALASSILSFSLGSFLGFLAAVRGGWVDQVLSRIVDLVMAVPSLISRYRVAKSPRSARFRVRKPLMSSIARGSPSCPA